MNVAAVNTSTTSPPFIKKRMHNIFFVFFFCLLLLLLQALILPPQPLPSSELPDVLEPYRKQLEEAFDCYIRDLCDRAAAIANVFQANAKSRYATSVYSRFVSPPLPAAVAAAAAESEVAAIKAKDANLTATAAAAGETKREETAAATTATAGGAAADPTVSSSSVGDEETDDASSATESGRTAALGKKSTGRRGGGGGSPTIASSIATNKAEEAVGAATRLASSTEGNFSPPTCPERILYFLKGEGKAKEMLDTGPFAKLTAVVSLRRMNTDSCWALAWTEMWEIYFSLRTRRLAVEGDVRLHSHSCEDWNAQVIYSRRFRNSSSLSSPSAPAAPPVSPSSAAAAYISSAAAPPQSPTSAASDVSSPAASAAAVLCGGEAAQEACEEDGGLYVDPCDEVSDPAALTERILDFIRRKHRDVAREQAFFRHTFAPLMLKRLRRVLSLTGERFDWQQQQIHLQPRQQL